MPATFSMGMAARGSRHSSVHAVVMGAGLPRALRTASAGMVRTGISRCEELRVYQPAGGLVSTMCRMTLSKFGLAPCPWCSQSCAVGSSSMSPRRRRPFSSISARRKSGPTLRFQVPKSMMCTWPCRSVTPPLPNKPAAQSPCTSCSGGSGKSTGSAAVVSSPRTRRRSSR